MDSDRKPDRSGLKLKPLAQPDNIVADCPVAISDIESAIDAGEFVVADSYIRRLSAADPDSQRALREAIPDLLERVRANRRELAAKLRLQDQTRHAKQAYRA